MDDLTRQVARAQRRLFCQQFLERLSWSWLVLLAVAAAAVAASKVWPVSVDGTLWTEVWLGGALAVGVVAALIWTYCASADRLEAALEIDRRFGLRERVSSSLSLAQAERETHAGQALVADALHRVNRLDVAQQFPLRLGQTTLLPLAPGLVVLLLTLFVDNRVQENQAAAKTVAAAAEKQTQAANRTLERKLAERRKQAEERNLTAIEAVLRQLQQGAGELAKKEGVDRKQALGKLNDLAKDLEKRREKLGGAEALKQQFQQLRQTERGPASALAQSLKNGDFQRAARELEKLQRKLDGKNGQGLDDQARQDLAKQLEAMRKSLEQAAEARQQAERDLQRQLEQLRKAGDTAAAQKVQEQLDKLAQQASQHKRMEAMAKQLAEAAQALQQGQMSDVQKAMDALAQELGGLQSLAEEMELLDDVAQQLADAKAAMACKNCGGEGCEQCQGRGFRPSAKIGKNGMGAQIGGLGAPRDVEENDSKLYDTTEKSQITKGPAVVAGTADGPNTRGVTRESIKQDLEQAQHEAADPLANQKLPREYRLKAGKYFDRYRAGRDGSPAAGQPLGSARETAAEGAAGGGAASEASPSGSAAESASPAPAKPE